MADDSDPRFKQLEGILSAQYKRKISLKKVDVKEPLVQAAVRIVCAGLEKKDREAMIAKAVKDNFDSQFGPKIWQVVVGRKFGSHVTHEETGFLYFSVSRVAVLIFIAKAK